MHDSYPPAGPASHTQGKHSQEPTRDRNLGIKNHTTSRPVLLPSQRGSCGRILIEILFSIGHEIVCTLVAIITMLQLVSSDSTSSTAERPFGNNS